jgi:hypothetical protein
VPPALDLKENFVKQIRKRLTYANVMSSIAVFLILGGATALAAGQLGKNTVGTKQLKKNAVTTAKIKKEAVTTAKIKNGAVTGAKVNLSSLGTVPSATNATNATNAGNASTVGGQTVQKISWVVPANSPEVTLFNAVGLKITASCDASGNISADAIALTNNSELQVFGNEGGTFFDSENSSFTGPVSIVNGDGSTHEGGGSLAYGTADGHVATMTYGFDFIPSFHTKNNGCGLFGEIIYS